MKKTLLVFFLAAGALIALLVGCSGDYSHLFTVILGMAAFCGFLFALVQACTWVSDWDEKRRQKANPDTINPAARQEYGG